MDDTQSRFEIASSDLESHKIFPVGSLFGSCIAKNFSKFYYSQYKLVQIISVIFLGQTIDKPSET